MTKSDRLNMLWLLTQNGPIVFHLGCVFPPANGTLYIPAFHSEVLVPPSSFSAHKSSNQLAKMLHTAAYVGQTTAKTSPDSILPNVLYMPSWSPIDLCSTSACFTLSGSEVDTAQLKSNKFLYPHHRFLPWVSIWFEMWWLL